MVTEVMNMEKAVTKIIKDTYGESMEVIQFENESGTKRGDNYGSDLFFVNITIKEKTGKETKLPLVVKRLPTSQSFREVFNVKVAFPKEAAFYQKVLPEYIKLGKESGFDEEECTKAFPEFIGALFGPNGEVNEDTTLLLKNIKPNGYRLASRLQGLDLDHAKLVMKEIALFHSLGIALKRRKPDIFDEVLKDAGRPFKQGADVSKLKDESDAYRDQLLNYLKTLEECAEYVPRLSSAMENHFFYKDVVEGYEPVEPFCTFVHNDLWVNNIMFCYDEFGSPKSLKFVDFQATKIGSPVSDVMHLLYLSTSLDVLRNNFEELLRMYHDCFSSSLKRLGIVSEEFNWENFRAELAAHGQHEATRALCMLRVIKTEQKSDLGEVSLDTFTMNFDEESLTRIETWHAALVVDFARRGWI